ncbi:hypothetical protein [Pseudonocardia sp. ICBG1034]|uniref:hypothetical protein n=1 Tax=Pseudonocardia sp. ICBG1034 TaxID=2844381 RepID=UPI001CC97AAD|nr:hypothetical protein [Pseudonocardia sp. ICBG1034]
MSEAFSTEVGPWLRGCAQPTVDLDAVALLFAPPVLYGEFYPWEGASLAAPPAGTAGRGPAWPRPSAVPSPEPATTPR